MNEYVKMKEKNPFMRIASLNVKDINNEHTYACVYAWDLYV